MAEKIEGGRFFFGDDGVVEESGVKMVSADATAVLDSASAMRLWEMAKSNGWVYEQRQPLLSQPKAACRMVEVV